MTQDEFWMAKYKEVMDFMGKNHRNPPKYDAVEKILKINWIFYGRCNRK